MAHHSGGLARMTTWRLCRQCQLVLQPFGKARSERCVFRHWTVFARHWAASCWRLQANRHTEDGASGARNICVGKFRPHLEEREQLEHVWRCSTCVTFMYSNLRYIDFLLAFILEGGFFLGRPGCS